MGSRRAYRVLGVRNAPRCDREELAGSTMIRMTWPMYERQEVEISRVVYLTPRETELLSTLLVRRGHIISANELIEAIWTDPNSEPECARNIVYHYIGTLKAKLGAGVIECVESRGYMIPE